METRRTPEFSKEEKSREEKEEYIDQELVTDGLKEKDIEGEIERKSQEKLPRRLKRGKINYSEHEPTGSFEVHLDRLKLVVSDYFEHHPSNAAGPENIQIVEGTRYRFYPYESLEGIVERGVKKSEGEYRSDLILLLHAVGGSEIRKDIRENRNFRLPQQRLEAEARGKTLTGILSIDLPNGHSVLVERTIPGIYDYYERYLKESETPVDQVQDVFDFGILSCFPMGEDEDAKEARRYREKRFEYFPQFYVDTVRSNRGNTVSPGTQLIADTLQRTGVIQKLGIDLNDITTFSFSHDLRLAEAVDQLIDIFVSKIKTQQIIEDNSFFVGHNVQLVSFSRIIGRGKTEEITLDRPLDIPIVGFIASQSVVRPTLMRRKESKRITFLI